MTDELNTLLEEVEDLRYDTKYARSIQEAVSIVSARTDEHNGYNKALDDVITLIKKHLGE